jgi:hypothetical protein
VVWLVVVAFVVGACGGSKANGANTRVTVGPQGPLDAGLLTQTQVRQVPGFATAKVTPLADIASLADPDPRGPCGAKVPAVPLTDVAGVTVLAETIRGAAQLVIRLPKGDAEKYLDARQANTSKGCPEYQTTTRQGLPQRVLLVRVVRLHNEFEQGLAVVTALKIGKSVRAATQIEIRRGDILSRTVVFTNVPISNVSVRGIAAVMGENLLTFDE